MTGPLIALLTMMVLLAIIAWLFRPESGIIPQLRRGREYARRVLREDALKHLQKAEEDDFGPTLESLAGALQVSTNQIITVMNELLAGEMVHREKDRYCLTTSGREYALRIIRAHRLWERYLADRTGYGALEWHRKAERMEHRMTTAEVEALALKLGHPTHDPHGDPIPTVDGEHLSHSGQSLSTAPLDTPLRIVHIEDEPEVIYAQLLAEGLFPGMTIKVLESTPRLIRCWTERDECTLAPVVAANVSVEVLAKTEQVDLSRSRRLSQLALGETARIVQLSPAIHGLERRRLMDLGFLKGTVVQAEVTSPSQDPVGYKVRGTLIALRKEQTHQIYVEDEATPNKSFSNTTTSEQSRGESINAS